MMMARPRTYDADDALDAAMLVFWRRGYAETSYDDLTKATGVSRKGLYTSFGDKRSLFLKALERYRKTHAMTFLCELEEADAGAAAIRRLFLRIAEASKSHAGRMGCFMANTANDETARDPDVAKQLDLHLSLTSKRFRTVLARSGFSPERTSSLGDYLTGLLHGLFVLAHAGAEANMIDAYVQEGLRVLEA